MSAVKSSEKEEKIVGNGAPVLPTMDCRKNLKSEIKNEIGLQDLIRGEVNIKEIIFDDKITGEVELDTNITEELEAVEAFLQAWRETANPGVFDALNESEEL